MTPGNSMRTQKVISLLYSIFTLTVLVNLFVPAADAAGVVDPLIRPAQSHREPSKDVLLDVTSAGNRIVAVGERGIIVLSDENGMSWRQAKVPTSISLTAVTFPTPMEGWAVGHAGVVLHTQDGGQTWNLQLDGIQAAKLALSAAQENVIKAGAQSKRAQALLNAAQYLVDDGADKPFLDLAFEDEYTGYIVGAYGLMFNTVDGGKRWQPWMTRLDNPMGLHINAIKVVGQDIYLAGEQGLFLRSTDKGENFTRLPMPYEGSFFALTANSNGQVLVGGLRGNVLWSNDKGDTFKFVEVPEKVSITDIGSTEEGLIYFSNQAGSLLACLNYGHPLFSLDAPRLPPIAALMPVGKGKLFTVGFGGVIPVSLEKENAVGGRQ